MALNTQRADRARGEERRRLVERLIRELPKLDPFEDFSAGGHLAGDVPCEGKVVKYPEFILMVRNEL